MLPELTEQEATGAMAQIYHEIRTLCAVPYVSSLQRHLATRPGWLEWSWAAIKPAFANGLAQTTAWKLAAEMDMVPLPVLSRSALRALGVDADGEQAIRTVCESFIRVSPTNLMFSGLLRQWLTGGKPAGESPVRAGWMPPAALPALPSLLDPNALTPDEREVLFQFGTQVAGQPFVPGLYRMLAHWPAYLAHLSALLGPRFHDAATTACCHALARRIDDAVPAVFATLPEVTEAPMPPSEQFSEVIAALDRYRETSPQMVVFGTLIRDALPA
jgi:hypothetical protein